MIDLKASTDNSEFHGTTTSGTCFSVHHTNSAQNTKSVKSAKNKTSSNPMVFIHGVGLNQAVWQPQIEAFTKTHTILVYDILGHGDSPTPDDSVTLFDYVEQLSELLEHLEIDSAHIIGHSMGALISVAFALSYPSKVCSIIPMNIVYKRTTAQRKAVLKRANEVLENNKITGVDTALNRWFSKSGNSDYKASAKKIKNWINSTDPVGYGRTYRLFAQSDNAFEGKLDRLKMPVFYLTGNRDNNSTPSMSRLMANLTPNGIHAVINNEAHMMAYISPGKVNPLIDVFISDVEREK